MEAFKLQVTAFCTKLSDILGRMLRQRDVTIDMLREQLEAATLEAESESRTAEINRQNDWKECHALDIQAKQHVAKTTQQLHSSRTRSDMAERASSDAHEQRDNNNAHISRLQNYLSHIESQLKTCTHYCVCQEGTYGD